MIKIGLVDLASSDTFDSVVCYATFCKRIIIKHVWMFSTGSLEEKTEL